MGAQCCHPAVTPESELAEGAPRGQQTSMGMASSTSPDMPGQPAALATIPEGDAGRIDAIRAKAKKNLVQGYRNGDLHALVKSRTFEARFKKQAGSSVGISFSMNKTADMDAYAISEVKVGGTLAGYNATKPESMQVIAAKDFLVSVNGKTEYKDIAGVLSTQQEVDLVFVLKRVE
mmetsp:Transcript_101662/g.232782  ORF Transcript_101662/g.232782 Transcript_101662/m.232782 type:complete len:176 (+) Transcript_101662:66-593(+)